MKIFDNMKIQFIFPVIGILALAGCDSYLDRQPDDQLTSDSIWEKRNTTTQYLYNVYSWQPNEVNLASHAFDHYVSDEATASFPGWMYELVIHGTNTPTNYHAAHYANNFYGINEATIFINNVDRCPELNENEKSLYKAEARFLRAYYYFRTIRYYGPVFFFGDNVFDLTTDIATLDRAPWQTLVDFICSECDKAAADLPDNEYWGTTWQGRATQGAALALKAKVLLYSARPLFNGQNGTGIYDGLVNIHGEKLFNTTYDEGRWKLAADAAKAVIDLNQYSLVGEIVENCEGNENDFKRGLSNLTELFINQLLNDELIYTYQDRGTALRHRTTPTNIVKNYGSWGAHGATWKLVDAFAMQNGVYPVKTEYWDTEAYAHGLNVDVNNPSQVDPKAGYSETGYTKMKNPLLNLVVPDKTVEKNTKNHLVGREARFYRNIVWGGMQWYAGGASINSDVEFFVNGKNGPITNNDYCPTGYMGAKWYNPLINPVQDGNCGFISWPIFRLGGVYLDYIEALNEYSPSHPDILKYWNMIRNRAGVPNIEAVYPGIVGDKDLQRLYIHRERMIEMCFESQRWFDTRTWMTAEVSNDGYTVGCNLRAGNSDMDSEYWKRSEIGNPEYGFGEGQVIGPRVFKKKHYFLPFMTSEVNKIPALKNSQNYGW